jgi:hypothetical protein
MVEKKMKWTGDSYSETLTYLSECMKCKHFITTGHCKAYPDGIPMDIWTATTKHDATRKGDHGIQFESRY